VAYQLDNHGRVRVLDILVLLISHIHFKQITMWLNGLNFVDKSFDSGKRVL
jgi:hypothetical protein